MPTYEYKCQECAHAFEAVQRMTDAPLQTCPVCQGRVKRLIGAGAGLIFKGSGFYITDSRSQTYKEAARKEQSASSSSAPAPASSPAPAKSAGKD